MSDWTDADVAELRRLWALEGAAWLSTAAIGRAMGKSKNGVVGKAHRIGLPSRPSPINLGAPHPPRPARNPRATLPVLPAAAVTLRLDGPGPRPSARTTLPPVQAGRPVLVAPAPLELAPRVAPPSRQCRWPEGDPKEADFRFCEAPCHGTYCHRHRAVAFVRVAG